MKRLVQNFVAADALPSASANEGSRKKSQRDFVPKPRVVRNELPWENTGGTHYPNGVASPLRSGMDAEIFVLNSSSFLAATPLGLVFLPFLPRVARSSQPWANGWSPVGILQTGQRQGTGKFAL